MSKITRKEIEKRIDETERVLLEQLHLKENLSVEELSNFYVKFIPYLMHDRNDKALGRTPKTLKENIDKYVEFCKNVGLTEKEIIISIGNFPSIIHTFDDEFVDKFVIMGAAENEENTLRKEKLITNPRAFTIDITTLYARYRYMQSVGYPINWSNLVKATNEEFSNIFVKNRYYKPYKRYDSLDEFTVEILKDMYPINYQVINDLRKLDINAYLFEGVMYGSKK